MHPQFLDYLRCPDSGEGLTLEADEQRANGIVVTGTLTSPNGRAYPIVRAIPRFVDGQQYVGSFGYEWQRWPRIQFESDNVGRPMQGHTTRMFDSITASAGKPFSGQTIVEFGCGPGRFLDVVRRRGARAVGLELSQAVESARKNFADDPDVLIVQGDILRPPFKPQAFDAGYTIGVLHHTPDPPAGLKSLVQTVRPGGWVSCCVYPRGEFYDYPSVARFRSMRSWLGFRGGLAYSQLSAYVLAPLFARLARIGGIAPHIRNVEREFLPVLHIPDARWRLLDIFDAITPQIASTHDWNELHAWFRDSGCEAITQTPWCQTSAVAHASGGMIDG